MFIELTDILRCPQPHEELYLVLIPDEMAQRSVRAGRLGCPSCLREYVIEDGVARFADTSVAEAKPPAIEPEALAAFLGLSGSGGYVSLVGGGSSLGAGLTEAVPGVHFVSINPPAQSTELPMLSLLRADSIPLKSRSVRGVVLLPPFSGDITWVNEAVRVVLPGRRVVGQGEPPLHPQLEILASADRWWVAQSLGSA